MKYIKKFNEEGEEISTWDWCKKLQLKNCTITDDNIVNIDSSCSLYRKRLEKIPIQFGTVNGNFNCGSNYLTSLEGCPIEVNGEYHCGNNRLISLQYSPLKVKSFDCSDNKLTSLEWSPKFVSERYSCSINEIKSLVGCPENIPHDFNCSFNNLINLIGGPKIVGHNYNCLGNELTSLDGGPESIGRIMHISDGIPLYYLYRLFKNYKLYKDSTDYNYLRGDSIIKLRFQEACDEAGIKVPESIPGYKYI